MSDERRKHLRLRLWLPVVHSLFPLSTALELNPEPGTLFSFFLALAGWWLKDLFIAVFSDSLYP